VNIAISDTYGILYHSICKVKTEYGKLQLALSPPLNVVSFADFFGGSDFASSLFIKAVKK